MDKLIQQKVLEDILKNREERSINRNSIAKKGYASISLNFNIPGYPKSSKPFRNAFNCVKKDLCRYLISHRINPLNKFQITLYSECGDFFLIGVKYAYEDRHVKNLLESFEENHPLGRILDVDLMNSRAELITSGKSKKCFVCDCAAIECMKSRRHESAEITNYINSKVKEYLKDKRKKTIVSKIAEKALTSSLFEVSIENKPGLVCPSSQGSHSDMDFFTFLKSSAALSDYWKETAKYGYEIGGSFNNDLKVDIVISKLRMMGLEAEEKMFEVTNGVNTQKGMIFLMGLGCFASAAMFAKNDTFCKDEFRDWIKNLMEDIVMNDLDKSQVNQGTHGEIAFNKYGKELAGGARLEAQDGYPTVFEYSLDFLNNRIEEDYNELKSEEWQEILSDLLILIISKSNDINILFRRGVETLKSVHYQSNNIVKEADQNNKNKLLNNFSEFCMLKNISPGGAADLLALSLFVFFNEKLDFSDLSYA